MRGCQISVEQAEEGGRLLRLSDHLSDAIDVVYGALGVKENERWAILAALYELDKQTSEEFSRFRGGSPPAA